MTKEDERGGGCTQKLWVLGKCLCFLCVVRWWWGQATKQRAFGAKARGVGRCVWVRMAQNAKRMRLEGRLCQYETKEPGRRGLYQVCDEHGALLNAYLSLSSLLSLLPTLYTVTVSQYNYIYLSVRSVSSQLSS